MRVVVDDTAKNEVTNVDNKGPNNKGVKEVIDHFNGSLTDCDGFKYLDHTADAKIIARGRSLERLFENLAIGVFKIIKDPSVVEEKITFSISLKAKSKERLLFEFIDELLFLLDSELFLLSSFKELSIVEERAGDDASHSFHSSDSSSSSPSSLSSSSSSYSLKALLLGDKLTNYSELGCNVKAVTYNDLFLRKIRTDDKGVCWEGQLVVDL